MVPKKSSIIVKKNEKGEKLQTRVASSWRVHIDYQKCNSVTKKDHYPLPFIDQILEKLPCQNFINFLMGFRIIIILKSMSMIKRKQLSLARSLYLLLNLCHLDYVTCRLLFKDV